jgi:hypothetical protein
VKRLLVLAPIAAIALLGAGCTSPTGSVYPMTVGSTWNYAASTLTDTALASLDTVSTVAQTSTALEMAKLINGKDVTKFKNESTIHHRRPDTTYTTTSYNYVAEVGDTIFVYVDTTDTAGTPMMRSTPAVGQTWTEGDAAASVVGQEDVTVAAGTYKDAWKVKLTYNSGAASTDIYQWFAAGTGVIKVSFDYTNGGTHTVYNSELTSAVIK